ncbi:hypothetical protein GWN42_13685, partial [candidate division KSB1 bacterium]|nr:hypothetical protein [Gammaproteobacteria bacterium]NIV93810.1 hypothetical protein [candidate division KSB1 bacterium]
MNFSKTLISPGVYRFVVNDEQAGQRLDQYISSASDKFTRGLAKKIIDLGGVHYAGRRTRRCSQVVASGESVEVFVDDSPLHPMDLSEQQIIYRDQDIIVINKPA